MTTRFAWLMLLGTTAFACAEERPAASPSAAQVALEPAHPSPDPPPAVPLTLEPPDSGTEAGPNEAGAAP